MRWKRKEKIHITRRTLNRWVLVRGTRFRDFPQGIWNPLFPQPQTGHFSKRIKHLPPKCPGGAWEIDSPTTSVTSVKSLTWLCAPANIISSVGGKFRGGYVIKKSHWLVKVPVQGGLWDPGGGVFCAHYAFPMKLVAADLKQLAIP